jgi:hypothetical protein
MFSFLDVAGTMALRLPSRDRETFVDRYQSRTAEQHGRPMREYVVIPNDLLERTEELAGWFRLSYESIGTLKPKTTKGR